MKDNFSTGSDRYAKYRPAYPEAFFNFLGSIKTGSANAWDVGTGNGQVAEKLAPMFANVFASDISQSQIDQAPKLPNIHYSVQPAEHTSFQSELFDLVIVAQAIHWFKFNEFYAEVNRTAKNNSLFVALGYGKLSVNEALDEIFEQLYSGILGSYWDKERRYIDEGYLTIPFPFKEIDTPEFSNAYEWTFEHLVGYFNTWSAVKHYREKNEENPVSLVSGSLKKAWGKAEKYTVRFPMLLRAGIIKPSDT